MLYALRFTVQPGSDTARRLHTHQNLDYVAEAEIGCEIRPVYERGLNQAVAGMIENPDIETLTITRLRNYRNPNEPGDD